MSEIETKTPQIVKKDSRPDLDFIGAQSITWSVVEAAVNPNVNILSALHTRCFCFLCCPCLMFDDVRELRV